MGRLAFWLRRIKSPKKPEKRKGVTSFVSSSQGKLVL